VDVGANTVGEVGQLTKSQKAKDKRLREIYNTTLEAHNEKRYVEQSNRCAICNRDFKEFICYQDHDHRCCPRRTKRFCGKCNRGLLCFLCNKKAVAAIEYMEKVGINPERVLEYIRNWTATITARGGYAPKAKVIIKKKRLSSK
jgi:hypothetical protein